MTLVSIPGNPCPDGAVTGRIQTPDGVTLRFARWDSPADAKGDVKGTVCVFTGRSEFIEKYFETVRDLRATRLCGRDHGLARAGAFVAATARSAQGTCRELLGFRDRRRDIHASTWCCRIVRRPIMRWRTRWAARPCCVSRIPAKRWFERMVLVAPLIDLPQRALLMAVAHADADAAACGLRRHATFPAAMSIGSRASGFPGNPLTTDPVRYARNAAIVARGCRRSVSARPRWPGSMRRSTR